MVWSDNYMTHASAAGFFASNPAPGSTLTLNGATWTFVSGTPVGNQTQIGPNKSRTVENLVHDLNTSSDPLIQQADYAFAPGIPDPDKAEPYDVLIIQSKAVGPSGGNFTLAANQPGGCVAGSCFINFPDQNLTRLLITLNLKTDQVPTFFAGTPGNANCRGKSVSALAQKYRGLDRASESLGYASVADLQDAIATYCE
jgi:hypothetical protein